jgi:tetratricopeptide (TPR) repeat protein
LENEEIVLSKLEKILNEYLKQEEDSNYFSALILRVKILIHMGKYQNGLEELNSEGFINRCKKNPYFEGERLYFIGIISSSASGIEGLKPAIEYFLKAYDIIKDLFVTELTWRVLFALTINYAERGNSNRAKTFLIYTKSVLDYISDKISDPRLKLLYSDQPERHTALATINKLTEKL